MNIKTLFTKGDKAGCVLGAVLLVSLTGCVAYVDRPPEGSVYVAPPAVEVGVAEQDDYIYYPNYQVYYSSSRHQYAYQDGRAWVSRPAPRGVSVDVLMASPSVRMDFHDSPANHHAAVVRQYPKNWSPSGSNPGQKQNHDGGQHGDNNGR